MLKILQSEEEIDEARRVLSARGLDCLPGWGGRILQRLGWDRNAAVGDYLKSWDVLKTVEFIEKSVPHHRSVLDIGAYASEILVILQRMGFADLHGIDFNAQINRMPGASHIRFVVGDFYSSPYPDAAFDAITAISVIEHGFDKSRLLGEITRLLRGGGFFIASFDYWPEKITTEDIRPFGLCWTIFSAEEVAALLKDAADFGLFPVGELSYGASAKPVKWEARDYTFGWLVLQKQ
ncbi:MAG: class I SAM-dependent methyltransferase [Thermodesulfobacteriota bacterium]